MSMTKELAEEQHLGDSAVFCCRRQGLTISSADLEDVHLQRHGGGGAPEAQH